jgi:hypothetical protein
MVALIIGTIFYIILFLVAAYFVNERITRDVKDEKTKREYRK